METKINVAKILAKCPSDMELNCVMFENLYFDCIDYSLKNCPFPICCYYVNDNGARSSVRFSKYGTYLNLSNDKCVIFPKGKTTWEGFVPPCSFKDGDVIYNSDTDAIAIYHKQNDDETVSHCYLNKLGRLWINHHHSKNLSYWGFATKEKKDKLFKVIKDNGYMWNPEKKCLKKLPTFKDGDIVAAPIYLGGTWIGIYKQYDDTTFEVYCSLTTDNKFNSTSSRGHILEGTRLATEEEKEKFFKVIKDFGYKWNAETKTLEKLPKFKVGDRIKSLISSTYYTIVSIKDNYYHIKSDTELYPYKVPFEDAINYELAPNKFDISTLKPFDKVLVRYCSTDEWDIDFFGYYSRGFYHTTGKGMFRQCIPYEGHEHIVGTRVDCDEFYKNWE